MLARIVLLFALCAAVAQAFFVSNARISRSSLRMGLHDHELNALDGR
jgi:hypothetical protein